MTSNQPLLGVNIDHIATLRQARGVAYPDPVAGALICEQAGRMVSRCICVKIVVTFKMMMFIDLPKS